MLQANSRQAPRGAQQVLGHLALLVLTSAAYEAVFLTRRINPLDEGWPLYSVSRMLAGGNLYEDVFWVFPPGHLLPAWLGFAFGSPSVLATRLTYAVFATALCVAIYFLGRRLMPAPYALLGAMLLALAAPRSHLTHAVFGYRYLVFSVLALLAFSNRQRSGNPRWMLVAGGLTGLALLFRLTPAVAVCVAIAVALPLVDRSPRVWLRDGSLFAAGLFAVVVPAAFWWAPDEGVVALWREIFLHPVAMRLDLPMPELFFPDLGSREEITDAFVALSFRAYGLLFVIYGVALLAAWFRSSKGRPFEHTLLVATVVWGGVYYSRALGRADEAHLDSAIPPVCLLLAHALSLAVGRIVDPRGWRLGWAVGLGARTALLAAWILILSTDVVALERARDFSNVGPSNVPLAAAQIRSLTAEGDSVLDLSNSPMLLVLAKRFGPGHRESIVVPGTFLDLAEEQQFVAGLRTSPPAMVIWPLTVLDGLPSRRLEVLAPELVEWVRSGYAVAEIVGQWALLLPTERLPEGGLAVSCQVEEAPSEGWCERWYQAP